MINVSEKFFNLSTPLIADACVRLNLPIRSAPHGIKPNIDKIKAAGKALPVKHFGSVDVFLEKMNCAEDGDILVIDNNGRKDEGCIGDLTVLEAISSNIKAFVIWGTYRDNDEILKLNFPVFSYGTWPVGPIELRDRSDDALEKAEFPNFSVINNDYVFSDSDGILFVDKYNVEKVIEIADQINETERKQTELIKNGNNLRNQLGFQNYLIKNKQDPRYTFRKHLRSIGGAMEE